MLSINVETFDTVRYRLMSRTDFKDLNMVIAQTNYYMSHISNMFGAISGFPPQVSKKADKQNGITECCCFNWPWSMARGTKFGQTLLCIHRLRSCYKGDVRGLIPVGAFHHEELFMKALNSHNSKEQFLKDLNPIMGELIRPFKNNFPVETMYLDPVFIPYSILIVGEPQRCSKDLVSDENIEKEAFNLHKLYPKAAIVRLINSGDSQITLSSNLGGSTGELSVTHESYIMTRILNEVLTPKRLELAVNSSDITTISVEQEWFYDLNTYPSHKPPSKLFEQYKVKQNVIAKIFEKKSLLNCQYRKKAKLFRETHKALFI